jgi:hypothetical protein
MLNCERLKSFLWPRNIFSTGRSQMERLSQETQANPFWMAYRTSSAVFFRSSLFIMLALWVSTVRMLMRKTSATSLLLFPSVMNFRTSLSLAVKDLGSILAPPRKKVVISD